MINPPLIFIYLYLSQTEIMSTSSISHYWGFLFFGISWEAALHLFGTVTASHSRREAQICLCG